MVLYLALTSSISIQPDLSVSRICTTTQNGNKGDNQLITDLRSPLYLESHKDELFSSLVELSTHPKDKLVKGDAARLVRVKMIEKDLNLGGGPLQGMFLSSFGEFGHGDRFAVVIVHNAEFSLEAKYTRCTSCLSQNALNVASRFTNAKTNTFKVSLNLSSRTE